MLRSRLFLPWLGLAAVCTGWMWVAPTQEVVPFHLIWVGLALAYGFEAWPLRPTIVACCAVSLAAGGILVHRAASGLIAWPETAEIPLMLLLAGLVVWHVRRRAAALASLTLLSAREAAAAEQRVRLARLTSHEMRTPLTIAQSYVELLLDRYGEVSPALERQDEPELWEDLEVVHDELGRLARVIDRLLRMIQLAEPLERTAVDVDAVLRETAHRWAAVADRNWLVDSDAGTVTASIERLRACLDTLIENAVRYTDESGTVRLFGFTIERDLWLGVADGGPGLTADLTAAVNTRKPHLAHLTDDGSASHRRSQTGLGIALVQEVVEARYGRVLAGRSHEGGALVLLVLPINAVLPGSLGEAPQHYPAAPSDAEAALWATLSPDPMPTTGAVTPRNPSTGSP